MRASIGRKDGEREMMLDAYVAEEGPRRGFSLVGWKENLPRNLATQGEPPVTKCLGQSLTYIVMRKRTMFATTITGTSHGEWLLYGLPLPFNRGGGTDGEGVGCTAAEVSPTRGCTLISNSSPAPAPAPPVPLVLCFLIALVPFVFWFWVEQRNLTN